MQVLTAYFAELLGNQKNVIKYVVSEFEKAYKAKDQNLDYEKQLSAELAKLTKSRQKFMDMYTDDLISREELNERLAGMRQRIEYLERELKLVSCHLTKHEQLEGILTKTFRSIEDVTDVSQMTNAQLRKIVQRIEVDENGNVDIYLQLMQELGIENTVSVSGDTPVNDEKPERFLWEIK